MKPRNVILAHLGFYACITAISVALVLLTTVPPLVGYDREGNCVYVEDENGRVPCPAELPRYHHSEIVSADYWEQQ